ncbi:MAG: MOSC domain-containing protein [Candidatus Acidiferrales bacterium]
MKIVSVNVGRPREIDWKGKTIRTSIFKEPVQGRVRLETLNFVGDEQADLAVHGGPQKAVYGYASEHYDFWQQQLPGVHLPWGVFGENLTTKGLLEEEINIGNRYQLGSAVVMVTQPRIPCYKLGVRFGRDDIVKRFLKSGRPGFYFSVIQEGEVGAGDALELVYREAADVTVADILRLYITDKQNLSLTRRAVQVAALADGWRDYFQRRLAQT